MVQQQRSQVHTLAVYQNSHQSNVKGPSIQAERLPHVILALIFRYLSLSDLASCMRVCRSWLAYLDNEDNITWRRLCARHVSESALADPYLLVDAPGAKAKLRAYAHAWNPLDCSRNGYIKTNGFTFHRNPIAQSTDGCRSRVGFKNGRHSWVVWWQGPLGTVAVIGVSTRHAALQCSGYVPLLGADDQAWAWNLVDNTLLHDGKTCGSSVIRSDDYAPPSANQQQQPQPSYIQHSFAQQQQQHEPVQNRRPAPHHHRRMAVEVAEQRQADGNNALQRRGLSRQRQQQHLHQTNNSVTDPYAPPTPETVKYQVGDKIRVCLDCGSGQLWFERGAQFLGVAFNHLPPVRLYPAVCAVYGNTEVSMVYTGPPLDG